MTTKQKQIIDKQTPEKIEELKEKHRKIKMDIVDLLDNMSIVGYTKERIKDELFKIYMELK